MQYHFKLESLDDRRVFAVQAIGLDVINDNIATVEVRELTRIFGLDLLNRGDGPVDLLIGVDHARLHLGDGKTRQRGHLVARRTLLGWVVFGGKPEQSGLPCRLVRRMVIQSLFSYLDSIRCLKSDLMVWYSLTSLEKHGSFGFSICTLHAVILLSIPEDS